MRAPVPAYVIAEDDGTSTGAFAVSFVQTTSCLSFSASTVAEPFQISRCLTDMVVLALLIVLERHSSQGLMKAAKIFEPKGVWSWICQAFGLRMCAGSTYYCCAHMRAMCACSLTSLALPWQVDQALTETFQALDAEIQENMVHI